MVPSPLKKRHFVEKEHSCYRLDAVAKLAWSVPRRAALIAQLSSNADQAARCSHEAVPSHVWGFRSQHQPSFGFPSLIQNAGTRWSPRREPAIEKPQFLAMTSGC